MPLISVAVCCALLTLYACKQKPTHTITPWGTTITTEGAADTTAVAATGHYTLDDIRQTGEMIVLTLTGPTTYYEYRGRSLGVHYLLAEKLAEHLGVTLRVDVCRDTLDVLQRLQGGEGDLAALPISKARQQGFIACGVETVSKTKADDAEANSSSWIVSAKSRELADAINEWYKPEMYAETSKQLDDLLTTGSVTRHVYPTMLSAKEGRISQYDALFKRYAPTAGVDWTLLAAQCYQESCFDPKAHSWAGAAGLMQIMPTTAQHLQLPWAQVYQPEPNIAAAARLLRELQQHFSDVSNPQERLKFALAAYNGGSGHVRDAMALTRKYGGASQRWGDVKRYILALSEPEYYQDPIVSNGYMRGSETSSYVDMIMTRWQQYRHALATGSKVTSTVRTPTTRLPHVAPAPSTDADAAHRSAKKNKWRKD